MRSLGWMSPEDVEKLRQRIIEMSEISRDEGMIMGGIKGLLTYLP